MYFRMEGRLTSRIKSRRFFCFLTLCLLVRTGASAHDRTLELLQDRINPALHAQPLAQNR
jgi:hypothetical protein